jgi:hypothetical protein
VICLPEAGHQPSTSWAEEEHFLFDRIAGFHDLARAEPIGPEEFAGF